MADTMLPTRSAVPASGCRPRMSIWASWVWRPWRLVSTWVNASATCGTIGGVRSSVTANDVADVEASCSAVAVLSSVSAMVAACVSTLLPSEVNRPPA